MTAKMLMDILARNNRRRVLLVRPNGSIRKIVYFDGIYIRFWYFDDNGKLESIASEIAPHGEMDLLACYADDIDCFGIGGSMLYTVEWC